MLCVGLGHRGAATDPPLIGAGTTIISFQNGVLKDQYRAAYEDSQIMSGVGYATTITGQAHCRQG